MQPYQNIVNSHTSSEACSLKLLIVGQWLSYLTLDWQFFVSQIQIWSRFFNRSIGWWVIGVFRRLVGPCKMHSRQNKVKSQTSSEACSLKLLIVGLLLCHLTLHWQFFISQIQIWSRFFNRSIGWWVIGVSRGWSDRAKCNPAKIHCCHGLNQSQCTKTVSGWEMVKLFELKYYLRSYKVGTLDWARPFPANASSTSSAGNSWATKSP